MRTAAFVAASLVAVFQVCASTHEEFECGTPDIEDPPEWITSGGIVPILLGVAVMFWGLTLICEEYCVPAISVLCLQYKISDNFAGSTIIGAGLSLPVLFASYVGLFASNSSIGLGTVVGGNIFNQTINIASSIFVSPNRRLKLCKVVLTREVALYATSNLLILWTVRRNLNRSFNNILDPADFVRCLSVPWQFSLLLVASFVAYCVLEAYFSTVVRFICRSRRTVFTTEDCESGRATVGSKSSSQGESKVTRSSSCIGNGLGEEDNTRERLAESTYGESQEVASTNNPSLFKDSLERDVLSDESYTDQAIGTGHEDPVTPVSLSDFVLYRKAGDCLHNLHVFGGRWERVHCTMHKEGYLSYRTRKGLPITGRHARFVDLSNERGMIPADSTNFEFKINAKYPHREVFHFRAPDEEVFKAVTRRLSAITDSTKHRTASERQALASSIFNVVTFVEETNWTSEEPEESFGTTALVEGAVKDSIFILPEGFIALCFYYLVHPVRILIYYSTPDVRAGKPNKRAILCVVMCVVWMAVASYVIIQGLNVIGNLMRVNGAIMGLTVGAWAASYPALWSSLVVARDGHGDIVTCNALGSNVFNNFIGIGLPWLTYSLVNSKKDYGDVQDGGIVMSFVVLSSLLAIFYIVLACSNYILRYWMAYMLCVAYVVCTFYLCYQMA